MAKRSLITEKIMAAIELPAEYLPQNGDELLVLRPHGYEVDRYVDDRWQGSRVTDELKAKWLASNHILLFEGEGYRIYRKQRFLVHQRVKVIRTRKEVVIDVPRSDLKPGIVVYEAKTPGGKFAGFYREDEIESLTEFVTHNQWDRYTNRVMRENCKVHGSSLSPAGISHLAHPFIEEIQDDRKGMIVKKGWREAMKAG